MFVEYYPICDHPQKKLIIMQDDTNGKLAVLKTVPSMIIEQLKKVDQTCKNLPQIHEFGRDYIIEKNLDGIDLQTTLDMSQLTFAQFFKIVLDVCTAVDELHRIGLCHMDISPSNIIYSNGCYYLIDFSAARPIGFIVEDVSYGSRQFCSPEHYGFDTISEASDIFNLGKFIKFLLPYISNPGNISFDSLIKQCTAVNKNQRIQSIEVFVEKFNFVCQQHTNLNVKNATIRGKYEPLIGGYVLTEEILNALTTTDDLVDFINKNEKNFEKMDVVDYFEKIISKKGLKKSEVILRSEIERTYGYQLLNGTKKPSRDKLIQLCMGAALNFDETQMALKRTGFAPLYPKNRRDCIIIYAVQASCSVVETDALLDRFKEKLLNED